GICDEDERAFPETLLDHDGTTRRDDEAPPRRIDPSPFPCRSDVCDTGKPTSACARGSVRSPAGTRLDDIAEPAGRISSDDRPSARLHEGPNREAVVRAHLTPRVEQHESRARVERSLDAGAT